VYAAYLVQPYSEVLATAPDTNVPVRQRLRYVLSTWNPYTVVLMASDIDETDVDEDGVDDGVDNCPAAYNPDQANCNRDAEISWNARNPTNQVKLLGDACDPVPCPRFNADRVTATRVTRGSCVRSFLDPSVCIGRVERDAIDVAPIGASPTDPEQTAAIGTNLPVPGVTTHARFCQRSLRPLNARFDCSNSLLQADRELDFFTDPADERLDAQHLWHRVTLAGCNLRFCPSSPRGTPFVIDYGTQQRTSSWRFQSDNAFWTDAQVNPRAPIIPTTPDDPRCLDPVFGAGTCLSGKLWLHGDTPVGSDAEHVTTPSGVVVGYHGKELANHYAESTPDAPFAWAYGGVRFDFPFLLYRTLPDPPPMWRFFEGAGTPVIRGDGGDLLAVFDDGHRVS
jgi:hypothetical protein